MKESSRCEKLIEQAKCYETITVDEITSIFVELELLNDYTDPEDKFRKVTNTLYERKFNVELAPTCIDHLVCNEWDLSKGCNCDTMNILWDLEEYNREEAMHLCGYMFNPASDKLLGKNYMDLRRSKTPDDYANNFHKRAKILMDLVKRYNKFIADKQEPSAKSKKKEKKK